MYRVRTVFTGVAGAPWYSNLYFDDQAPGGAEAAVQAVADFWQAIYIRISALIDWTVEGDVTVISPGTGEITGIFPVASITSGGGAAGELLPLSSQGLIRFSTGAYVGGREIRGRMFVPGLTEADSGQGVPTSDILTELNEAAEDLVNDPDSQLVVYSRKNFIQSPVVSAGAAPYWAVLRSRRD